MESHRTLILQLHFSTVPAALGLRLLQRAERRGYFDIRQFRRNDWQQAVEETETIPPATWSRWQESWPRARQAAQKQQELSRENAAEYRSKNQEGVLLYGSEEYPSSLYRLFRPPFVLFFRGAKNMLSQGSGFAVCGSRKATLQGRRDAFCLTYSVCSNSNFHLISGLSEGIELAACEGALASKKSGVGVLCCGLDAIAPEESQHMAMRLLNSGGLLLSEYPNLQPRQRYTFLQRNRILAALSASLIMAEIGPKTKSFNLIDYALELNHDVAALGNSQGVRRLFEQGCPHWPDAASLLKALGMECKISASGALPGNLDENVLSQQMGSLVAANIHEELLEQSQPYLGHKIEAKK
ncbi:MAG: DNA-processing protein DprA [Spirochaetota bacterium]